MLPVILFLQSKVTWGFLPTIVSSLEFPVKMGARVFAKTFTKQSFSGFVSADHLRHFILEGVVFDEEKTREGKNIILAASVSYPQTDLYIPFSITITPEGKMSISKNEDMEELPPMLGDSLN